MTTLRIGRPPRLPYRERVARLLNRLGRYALAWAVVVGACWWLQMGEIGVWIVAMFLASTICNPWRITNSRPRVVDAAQAVGRGEGAEHSARYRAMPARRLLSPLHRRHLPVATGSG